MLDYHTCSDLQLHDLYLSGDEEAGNTLVRRYEKLVELCSMQTYLAGGDRNDRLQEGRIGLLSAIKEYDPAAGASFRSFAELCIRRKLISAARSASRKKHAPLNEGVSIEQLQEENAAQFPDSEKQRSAEDLAIGITRIEELLSPYEDRLSAFEYQVLTDYLRGLSYKEIAARAGVTPKSVDNALQRIRKKLSKRDP